MWNCDSDLVLNVKGKLSINCNTLDVNAEKNNNIFTGEDMIINANNLIEKAREQLSLEPVKSMYVSTGELRENIVTNKKY